MLEKRFLHLLVVLRLIPALNPPLTFPQIMFLSSFFVTVLLVKHFLFMKNLLVPRLSLRLTRTLNIVIELFPRGLALVSPRKIRRLITFGSVKLRGRSIFKSRPFRVVSFLKKFTLVTLLVLTILARPLPVILLIRVSVQSTWVPFVPC